MNIILLQIFLGADPLWFLLGFIVSGIGAWIFAWAIFVQAEKPIEEDYDKDRDYEREGYEY